jgi:hypothetical protein
VDYKRKSHALNPDRAHALIADREKCSVPKFAVFFSQGNGQSQGIFQHERTMESDPILFPVDGHPLLSNNQWVLTPIRIKAGSLDVESPSDI